jgi:hypothetical protein
MRMNLGLFGDKIYRSRVNYTEMEGSYEYTDRFHLTSMKTELLSMVGPFFHLEPNQNNALSEKQFLNKALHRHTSSKILEKLLHLVGDLSELYDDA